MLWCHTAADAARKQTRHGLCPVKQVGSFGGIVDEVQALKRDKNVLMLELVRLRQQQQVKPRCLAPVSTITVHPGWSDTSL